MSPLVVLLGVLIAAALVAAVVLALGRRTALKQLEASTREVAALQRANAGLEEKVQSLARYQQIIDAEAQAAAIRREAQLVANAMISEGQQTAGKLHAEARAALDAARTEGEAARARGAETVASSRQEAGRIVDEAIRRAKEIAGEAMQTIRHAAEIEQTATAMKNVIEGYGDQYIVPTVGLLDELADELGFTEAGQNLKAARDRTRAMVKNGTAALCEYVEEGRRTTAIAFVIDAFNGKVDTILSSVREDNYGTLAQKIKDAYALVNHGGQAFRNARVTPEYLQARLEELRWSVVAQELKQKEREEQRELKERIREEEKAQREYERAMKEAEKEEETLRKAMDKARREFEKAGDEQKAKYEEQLQQLAEKLRLAEEKNRRALSMAQQTRAGYVYIISNVGSFGEDVFKIGLTRRLEPTDRIRELGDASVPFEFDVHAMIRSEDAPTLERALHKQFLRAQVNKVNPRKEFFRVPLHTIRTQVERMGLSCAWTMTAACAQWKETQAIERAMANKTFDETHWAETQIREHDQMVHETRDAVA